MDSKILFINFHTCLGKPSTYLSPLRIYTQPDDIVEEISGIRSDSLLQLGRLQVLTEILLQLNQAWAPVIISQNQATNRVQYTVVGFY